MELRSQISLLSNATPPSTHANMPATAPKRVDKYPYDRYDKTMDHRFFTSTISPALGSTILIKRSLSPEEYQWDRPSEMYESRRMIEALRNEVAAIAFIKKHTTIPVPNIIGAFSDRGAFYVMMERVTDTVRLADVPLGQQAGIIAELDGYVAQMQQLRSKRLGGVEGDTILPGSVTKGDWVRLHTLEFTLESTKGEDFVFCHGDLHVYNVLVDPITLTIKCLIDWEFAGFYPAEFEERWYLRKGRPQARIPEIDKQPEWARRIRSLATEESLARIGEKMNRVWSQVQRDQSAERAKAVPVAPKVELLKGIGAGEHLPVHYLDYYLIRTYQLFSRLIRGSPPPPPLLDLLAKTSLHSEPNLVDDVGLINDPDNLIIDTEAARKRWKSSHKEFVKCLVGITIAGCREVLGFESEIRKYLAAEVNKNRPAKDASKAKSNIDSGSPKAKEEGIVGEAQGIEEGSLHN